MRIDFVTFVLLSVSAITAGAQQAANLGRAEWYRPPQLSIMVGFIKDPEHSNFTVKQWADGIGGRFDAAQLVERAHRAGVAEIIWYDKWIDGLVFRKTKPPVMSPSGISWPNWRLNARSTGLSS